MPERWSLEIGKEGGSGQKERGEGEGSSPIEEIGQWRPGLTIRIYVLIDPRDMSVRYVGKTCGSLKKRLGQHVRNPRNIYVATWIRSLIALDLMPIIQEIEVIENSNDLDWQDRERFWISEYTSRGCSLTNLDSGGVGGKLRDEETKKKIGMGNKGKKRTPEQIEKLRLSHLGKKLTPEHCANMSKAVKGKPRGKYPRERVEKTANKLRGRKQPPRTREHRANISKGQMGKIVSEETRAKISASQRGKKRGPYSPEHRAAISASLKGRVIPPEEREKMRVSALRRWGKLPPTPEN